MSADSYISSGILELYVAGVLSPEEMAEVDAMAAQHPRIREEIQLIEESYKRYAADTAPRPGAGLFDEISRKISEIPPPAPVQAPAKSRSESRKQAAEAATAATPVKPIRETTNQPPVNRMKTEEAPRKRSSGWGWAIAASLLLAGSAAGNYYLYDQWQKARQELSENTREYDRMAKEFASTKASYSQATAQLEIYQDRNYKAIRLKGQDIAPEAEAMVYWNRGMGKVFLKVNNMPKAPEGMQYQLWAISMDDKPMDAGMVTAESASGALLPMRTIDSAKAFAITLEPKGGSAQPTSAIYAMANM